MKLRTLRATLARLGAGVAMLAMIGVCGSGSEADGSDGTSRARNRGKEAGVGSERGSGLRLDGIFRPCGAGPRSSANPFGLNNLQWKSAVANRKFLRETWSRGEKMQRATGKPVRIVIHQPGGWYGAKKGGMHGAVPTVAVMNGRQRNGDDLYPFRWSVWSQELSGVVGAHRDWILAVYFSGQVPSAGSQDAVDSTQAYETYDHENPRHRALVLGVVDQWLAVGVHEFIFDGSSRREEHPDFPALAAAIHAKGGRVFSEPHPANKNRTLRSSAFDFLDGSLATHQKMVSTEPESSGWVVPEGKTMMIALTGHRSARKPMRTPASRNDVREYQRRGFVVLSSSTIFDQLITRGEP